MRDGTQAGSERSWRRLPIMTWLPRYERELASR